jgi:hypothetical protein
MFLILSYIYIFFSEPYLSLILFSSCVSSIPVSLAMPFTTSNTSSHAIYQWLAIQQQNKPTPPMVRQCLHPAAPLLPATFPTSRLLLAAFRPTLALAIAAQCLVSHLALISALPTVQTK